MGTDKPLRILHLEDNADDSRLVRDMLAANGVNAELSLAMNRGEFEGKLEQGGWDIILADYILPDCTGLDALRILREKQYAVPFVILSGTIGEQAAIESLRAGATDYVLKQNRERLPTAVRRAVAEARERERRELAENDLRQSERQYRLLFQGNPNPMWVFDLETLKILEVNDAAVSHYGYAREEFLEMTLTDLRLPGRGAPENSSIWDAESQAMVWTHRRKNGEAMDMEVVWSPLAFRGRLSALALATDVTVRRRTAHQNAVFGKLSHQLSAVTLAAAAAMFICEAADELFHWDDFAVDLYDAEKETVISLLNITTIDGQRVQVPAEPQLRTTRAMVNRVMTRGAELISADETGARKGTTMIAPIRKGANVIGVLFVQSRLPGSYSERDLHTLQTLADQCSGALERVRAEEELRHSQQRFRELFESSPDAIFVEDLQGNLLDVNRSATRLFGLSREQLIGKNAITDLVPPELREVARQNFERLARGEISWIESERQRADGRMVPVEIRSVRLEFDGRPALLFYFRDITERRAAEAALRSSETLFRSVWENSVDGMRLTDQNGTIVAVNDAYCQMVGLTHEELEGKVFTMVYASNVNWEQLLLAHRDQFASGRLPEKYTREYILHNGRQVYFEVADSFVESGGKPRLLLSLFRDVTNQKRLEEQFRQSQKMEAIGQLAGGVAHDFNNILTVVLGHASLLALQPLDHKSLASAQQIKEAAERAAGLTRQLLAFGRKQLARPRPIDLNQIVGNLSKMLKRLLGEDISLQLNFSSEPALIEADPVMVEQVLMNLSVNSRDAMPRGGQLIVAVSQRVVDDFHASQFVDAYPGKFICLSHTDTGCGIPPENLTRIFEPFFTTKELGKGTGLGLATVFGIIKQHRGWLEVESELEKGTTFHVYLPATGSPNAATEEYETQFHARTGTETILVVEDERDLREIVTRTLNLNGYRVFQAVDGNNALQIWSEYKDKIDLLFTDIVMPGGLNGRELADRLIAEKPGLKVIFTTGYDADALDKSYKLDPQLNYLQKPYLPNDLARIVRRRLDENHQV
jgi:PAS domain S-box-containing protein